MEISILRIRPIFLPPMVLSDRREKYNQDEGANWYNTLNQVAGGQLNIQLKNFGTKMIVSYGCIEIDPVKKYTQEIAWTYRERII